MIRRGVQRSRQSTRRVVLRFESLESRTVLSVDALSALSSATAALTEVKPGLFVRPVSFESVAARFPLLGPHASFGPAAINSAAGPAVSAPYSPAQIRKAYGFDQLPYDGAGQTIAIIDAYDNPTIAGDLANFSNRFGLPAANFVKAIPNGDSYAPESTPGGRTPTYNSGWALEIALDVEWAHAIAPMAKILLVEAASAGGDLFSAVDYAVAQGANQISMSFGGGEFSGVSTLDTHFNKTSVSFFASAGDNGAEVEFPAVSPSVVGVGGTKISLDSAGDKLSETTWNGSGGGTSVYVARPSYQTGFQTSNRRGVPDIAYNADPNSGIYIVNGGSYYSVGGTSAGAPQWAGLAALVNQGRAANGLATIGTGLANGLNTALYALAGGSSYTNSRGDFTDITTGSNGNAATVGYDTATGLGSPVANKLVPDLIAYGVTATPTFAISDAGFETAPVGTRSFSYGTKGSAWTFSTSTGVSGNGSAFTSGNPNAPEGKQVAVLQGQGSFSQSVANWTAGSYSLSLMAAQRGNHGASIESFQVQIDGVTVGTIQPTGTSYAAYSTPAFTVTAGTHQIAFVGTGPTTSDNAAFLDAIAVSPAVVIPTPTPTIVAGDSGFENLPVGAGHYAYGPTGSPWTFVAFAGLTGNGSAFTAGNPNAPEGRQVAFIQREGKIRQSVANWTAGNHTLSFQAAQRGNYGTPDQVLQVFIDDTLVGTIRPTGTLYATYTTPSFAVAAGTHSITFAGTAIPSRGDHTVFIDAVKITSA